MFIHLSTIKERCECSYGNIGKIINAVRVLLVFKCKLRTGVILVNVDDERA